MGGSPGRAISHKYPLKGTGSAQTPRLPCRTSSAARPRSVSPEWWGATYPRRSRGLRT